MIIVHLADLHLGYRAYSRTNAAGVNQREADVAAAFTAAMERIPAIAPDLVVIAGDLFQSVRPSNAAINTAFRELSRLAERLRHLPIVVVAGDRETPRSSDTTSILELFREIPGVRVVTDAMETIALPELSAEVVAVPHAALAGGKVIPPPREGQVRYRVLVAHGVVEGAAARDRGRAPDGGATIPSALLELERWDYVALGHLSVPTVLEPHIRYPGSLERTSGNPWKEVEAKKGFLVYDAATASVRFEEIPNRQVLDLPPINAKGMSPAEVDAALRRSLEQAEGGIADCIVRLIVRDLPRSTVRSLDAQLLAEARASALHFLLDVRPPTHAPDDLVEIRGRTLDQQVEHYLQEVWSLTQEGVDRDRLVQLGLEYLERAGEEGRR